MSATVILGHVNRLGYLYCNECYPVEPRCGELVWSDSCYVEEECELCHRALSEQVAGLRRASRCSLPGAQTDDLVSAQERRAPDGRAEA